MNGADIYSRIFAATRCRITACNLHATLQCHMTVIKVTRAIKHITSETLSFMTCWEICLFKFLSRLRLDVRDERLVSVFKYETGVNVRCVKLSIMT